MTRLILSAAFLVSLLPVHGAQAAQSEEPMSTCLMCHEETGSTFATAAHSRAMARTAQASVETSCATCHQATEAHFDEQPEGSITRTPTDQACKTCHSDRSASLGLMMPKHVRHGVTCVECHDVGHAGETTDLSNACAACHQAEAAAFQMPFAHRDLGEPFACTTCHSAHGDGPNGRMALLDPGAPCVGCHVEKHQPFIFPHPPADRRGCVSCHQPHGSPNARQLTRPSTMMLCLECHVSVPAFHDVSTPRYRDCARCHTAIHGSNRDPNLFEE